MFEVFLTGATTGALVVMVGILVIQKLENYQRKQDDLQGKKARQNLTREGRGESLSPSVRGYRLWVMGYA